MAARTEPRLGNVPHFDVTTADGRRVRYQDIWQHRNLVLAVLPPDQHARALRYARDLLRRGREFDEAETSVVVTTEAVAGVVPPRVLVADRWGEIQHVLAPARDERSELPDVDELLSWIGFVRMQCPECPP